jgi:riboflavin kinase
LIPEKSDSIAASCQREHPPCRVLGRRAFILRTDANHDGTGRHLRTVVEIAGDVKLRDEYNLAEGDEISCEIES